VPPTSCDSRPARALESAWYEAARIKDDSNARAGRLSHEVGGTFDARLKRAGFGGRYAAEKGPEALVAAAGRVDPGDADAPDLRHQHVAVVLGRDHAPGSRYKRFWALILSDG
jgi:hypothetical protein